MRLTVVGSAPAWARGPGQPSSCYLVQGADDAIVLDMGQGSLGALHAVIEPWKLRAVVISHLHADHHADLIALRYLLRYGYEEPRHVELLAPPGLRARYDAFLDEPGFLDGLPGPDLVPGVRVVGALALEVAPVTHVGPSFGFRVSLRDEPDLPGIVYSGDCGRWQDLLPLIRPADTLLCEAFWGTRSGDVAAGHINADEAATAAREGHAAQLVMTHIEADNDPQDALRVAGQAFAGEVLLAVPGLVVEVGEGVPATPGAAIGPGR